MRDAKANTSEKPGSSPDQELCGLGPRGRIQLIQQNDAARFLHCEKPPGLPYPSAEVRAG